MGNCVKVNEQKIRNIQFGMEDKSSKSYLTSKHNILFSTSDTSKILNNWNSNQLDKIDQKMEQICIHQTKKHLNFSLFLQFFPLLKQKFPLATLKKFFILFDTTSNGYINIKELVAGLTHIYFIQKQNFGKILLQVYKPMNPQIIKKREMKQFIKQTQKFIHQKSKEYIQQFASNTKKISQFNKLIFDCFNIQKFRRLFDCFQSHLEEKLIKKLLENNQDTHSDYQLSENSIQYRQHNQIKAIIKIRKDDTVFLINKNWFLLWVNFILIYDCHEIVFMIEGEQNKSYSSDLVGVQNLKFIRPSRIQNRNLYGEYEGQLNPNVKLHEDYVIVPKYVWKALKKIYKGGPEIQRKFPYMYPTIIFQVYVNKKGFFENEKVQKLIYYEQNENKNLIDLIEDYGPNKLIYIKKKGEKRNWQKKDINKINLQQNLHLSFITLIDIRNQNLFIANYLSNYEHQKKRRIKYGDQISMHMTNLSKNVVGRVINMMKDSVKIHFQGMNYYFQKIYSLQAIQSKIGDTFANIKAKNMITGYKNIDQDSYIIAVLQCLLNTPYFFEYFLKKKYKKQIHKMKNDVLSKQLSNITRRQTQHMSVDDLTEFKQVMARLCIQQKKDYQNNPSLFLYAILNQLNKQLTSIPTNTQESQNPIVEGFFDLTINKKIVCMHCKDLNTTEDKHSYMLNITIPEDSDLMYEAIFYPATKQQQAKQRLMYNIISPKKLCKFAITIKKSETFQVYAQRFSKQIGLPLNKLCFRQIKNSEFRKHFNNTDFQSNLQLLNLNTNDKIYIYQLVDKNSKKQNILTRTLSLIQNDKHRLVDFSKFMEWNIGRIIQVNDHSAKISNYEGISEVQFSKISHFKSRTSKKPSVIIDVLHRKINKKTHKIQYFLDPFIVYISECNTWQQIKQLLYEQVQRYLQIIKNLNDNSTTNNNINQKAIKKNTFESISCLSIKVEEDRRIFSQGIQNICYESNNHIQQRCKIKILLSNSGDLCYKCKKKSKIYEEIQAYQSEGSGKKGNSSGHFNNNLINQDQYEDDFSKKTQHLAKKITIRTENYCYGNCEPISQDPIGLYIQLKKVFFTMDWNIDFEDQLQKEKINLHKCYQQVKFNLQQQYIKLEDCFSYYLEDKPLQKNCQFCKNNKIVERQYLLKPPNILIIDLKRFKLTKSKIQKVSSKIGDYKEIKLTIVFPFSSEDVYYLYAMICHSGENIKDTKWYSYILKWKHYWIKCVDDCTESVDFSQIKSQQICILFYRRRNITPSLVLSVL